MIKNGLDYDEIIEGLYQGAAPAFGGTVAGACFDVLVLAAREHQRADVYSRVDVICAPGDDDARQHRMERDLPTWQEAARLVAAHVRDGKKVLVTCMAGLNRSGMIVGLALHELTGWSGADVLEHVQASREMALCNETFANYIRSLPERSADVDT